MIEKLLSHETELFYLSALLLMVILSRQDLVLPFLDISEMVKGVEQIF
jgi:hypothetical protein